MFYSLTGTIIHVDKDGFAIQCGGVAFYCFASFNTLRKVGERGAEATVFTYLNVREDALDLFGFYDKSELECFKLLIGVTGVGPKAALAVLSTLEPSKLALCIASGDVKSITRAPGVGPKSAQRIVLELKDKLGSGVGTLDMSEGIKAAGVVSASANAEEAVSALEMLGYSRSEASVAVGKLDGTLPTDMLIKQALRSLSKM
ncbi:MAG: Holliday junction branch migration protein RuvA [Clostridiales bacterium]|nr:Holliday junction branch migration protein RuvA [Clostridiales bacterium]